MRLSLAGASLLLFGISLGLLIALTLSESLLVGAAPLIERLLTMALLVLPAAGGTLVGALSLRRAEGRSWMAVTGIVLNASFALFHLLIIFFAG